MKKHSRKAWTGYSLHSINSLQKNPALKKEKKDEFSKVPPPDEKTLTLLNEMVKESPFCFYYKHRDYDLL